MYLEQRNPRTNNDLLYMEEELLAAKQREKTLLNLLSGYDTVLPKVGGLHHAKSEVDLRTLRQLSPTLRSWPLTGDGVKHDYMNGNGGGGVAASSARLFHTLPTRLRPKSLGTTDLRSHSHSSKRRSSLDPPLSRDAPESNGILLPDHKMSSSKSGAFPSPSLKSRRRGSDLRSGRRRSLDNLKWDLDLQSDLSSTRSDRAAAAADRLSRKLASQGLDAKDLEILAMEQLLEEQQALTVHDGFQQSRINHLFEELARLNPRLKGNGSGTGLRSGSSGRSRKSDHRKRSRRRKMSSTFEDPYLNKLISARQQAEEQLKQFRAAEAAVTAATAVEETEVKKVF